MKCSTAAVLLLSAMFFFFPSDSYACNGTDCDGQDPVAEGCDQDAIVVQSVSIANTGATVRLLYSPSCETNWARVYSSSTRYLRARIRIQDYATGHYYELYYPSSSAWTRGTNIWTDMFYCPTGQCRARAYGYAKTSSAGQTYSAYTNWY